MLTDGESYKNLSKLFTFPSLYFAFFGFVFSFILLEYGVTWSRRASKAKALARIEQKIQR